MTCIPNQRKGFKSANETIEGERYRIRKAGKNWLVEQIKEGKARSITLNAREVWEMMECNRLNKEKCNDSPSGSSDDKPHKFAQELLDAPLKYEKGVTQTEEDKFQDMLRQHREALKRLDL